MSLRDFEAWSEVPSEQPTLRPYQTGAIEKIEDAITRGVRRLMLMLPTGGGKTLIASTMTATRKRVIFTVPRLELVNQTYEKFQQAGIDDVGIIQAFNPLTDSSRPIQIASVQTLQNRNIPPADLVFIDEAHILRSFYSDWFTRPEWSAVPFVGLSATPWTKGLSKLYQELIIASTTQDLIDQGHLSNFRVFAPSHPDLSGVHTVAGDYHEGELGHAMDKQPLIADVVDTWLKLARGRPTLCFAVNRIHAEHIQTKFLEAGVRAGYIDCFTKDEARKEVRRKLPVVNTRWFATSMF
jgi:superfamily II DNA or RNA helicase